MSEPDEFDMSESEIIEEVAICIYEAAKDAAWGWGCRHASSMKDEEIITSFYKDTMPGIRAVVDSTIDNVTQYHNREKEEEYRKQSKRNKIKAEALKLFKDKAWMEKHIPHYEKIYLPNEAEPK